MASRPRNSPLAILIRAAGAQLLAWLALAVAVPLVAPWTGGFSLLAVAGAQGLLACLLGAAFRLPAWWAPINAAFFPLALATSSLALDPAWYLAAFVALVLVFWSVFRGRVPLYLTSSRTVEALRPWLAGRSRLVDLGCGVGSVLAPVAREQPGLSVHGVESAPLPFLVARWRTRRLGNIRVSWDNFWGHDLSAYDVVYAYLSPAPMEALWAKVRREMKPGSLFISNSFPVPQADAAEVVPVADLHCSHLFVYRM